MTDIFEGSFTQKKTYNYLAPTIYPFMTIAVKINKIDEESNKTWRFQSI